MQQFSFEQPTDIQAALQLAAQDRDSGAFTETRFVAGGTTLIDLMKLDVERPRRIIDLNALGLDQIEQTPAGGLAIGALARNSDTAYHQGIREAYPVLSEALLSGASGQLRNMATTGGNLLQRTRCVYFRDPASPCNKREPGSGCPAINGYNRTLAIWGTSEHCIANNPSDMNVALTALDAEIQIQSINGERSVPVGEFFREPGDSPHIETVLAPGELITHVTLPPPVKGARSLYLKLRDRASYEFALASAAVVLGQEGSKIKTIRIAMGGIGSKPWRCREAERTLAGKAPTREHFVAAAEAELRQARPQSQNGFKVELAKRCMVAALVSAAGKA